MGYTFSGSPVLSKSSGFTVGGPVVTPGALPAQLPKVDLRIEEVGAGVYRLVTPDGGILALSEATPVVTRTSTGTAFTGACEYGGFVVRAVSGTVNITVYDAASATGTPIHTENGVALGAYMWAGDWNGARRKNSTGCHVVISGGGAVTIDVLVG